MCALLLAHAPALAEPDASPWRVGAMGGLTLSALGGHDAGVVAAEGTKAGPVVAGRVAYVWSSSGPMWRLQLEPSFVQRKLGTWIFSHLEAPVLLEAAWRWRTIAPFINAGFSSGWELSSTRRGSGGERADLQAATLHIAALAGAGVRENDPTSALSIELRYAHGMTSLDPETPGIDVRHRTILLLVGWETSF